MQRPVEIYRKRTRLMLLSAAGLGGAALLTWVNYDELVACDWASLFHAIGIAIPGIGGLGAFVELLSDMAHREPYLVVYDDHVEVMRWLSKNPWLLHFSDVEDMTDRGDESKMRLCCKLKPFLKKSDLPRMLKLNQMFFSSDYTIALFDLDLSGNEAYNMILDRYMKYSSRNRTP